MHAYHVCTYMHQRWNGMRVEWLRSHRAKSKNAVASFQRWWWCRWWRWRWGKFGRTGPRARSNQLFFARPCRNRGIFQYHTVEFTEPRHWISSGRRVAATSKIIATDSELGRLVPPFIRFISRVQCLYRYPVIGTPREIDTNERRMPTTVKERSSEHKGVK